MSNMDWVVPWSYQLLFISGCVVLAWIGRKALRRLRNGRGVHYKMLAGTSTNIVYKVRMTPPKQGKKL